MGLLGAGITEIIAVTKDNAAPIGIIQKPGQTPKMILFKGSRTCVNVVSEGWVTANFVSDSYLYPLYAFSDCPKDRLTLINAGGRNMQILKDADAWIAFDAVVLNETPQSYFIELTPLASETVSEGIRPVNRGFNAIIEATVHATRYVINHDAELLELIKYNLALAKKCGGEQEILGAELIARVCGLIE